MTVNLSNINLQNVAPRQALDALPAGWYNAQIVETEMKPTKDNTGSYMEVVSQILDGPYAQRKVFDRLNLQNNNPQTVEIAFSTLRSIYDALGAVNVRDSSELHGRPLMIKLRMRKATEDYDANNDVVGYDRTGASHTVVTQGPAGPALGMPAAAGSPPAWAVGAAAPQPAGAAAPQPAPVVPTAAPQPFAPPPGAQQPWAQPQAAPPQPAAAPAPPQPAAPVMTAKAAGVPYESFIAQGWTDATLVEHGYMQAAQPAAPAVPQAPGVPSAATAAQGPTPVWAR